jgi:segregation and condensation protein B
MLFLSRQPLGSRKLAQLAGLADGTLARTLVRKLNQRYDSEGNAFRVEEVAGGFQLLTRPKFAAWLRRLYAVPTETRLSPAAMETLAVVAYRQPVLRSEIEAIRGVQSDEVLRQLMERDLVRIAGRSGELGRPYLYATTKQFLQAFGLRRLDELPRAESLRNLALPAKINTINENQKPSSLSQPDEEEENVKTLIAPQTRTRGASTNPSHGAVRRVGDDDRLLNPMLAKDEEDEDFDDEEYDDEEFDDEDDDDDEDLDDDQWEEVEDEDFDEEDEDWDEDWDDDEDEDWDDEDEDEDEEEDEDED